MTKEELGIEGGLVDRLEFFIINNRKSERHYLAEVLSRDEHINYL